MQLNHKGSYNSEQLEKSIKAAKCYKVLNGAKNMYDKNTFPI